MDFLIVFMLTIEIMFVTSAPVTDCESINLKQFMDFKCNEMNKPNICPPCGECYGFQNYCDYQGEYKGGVESCFPGDISANDTAILQWCQQPGNILLHPTCKCACFSKFDKTYCSHFCDHVTQPTVDNVTSSADQDCNPRDNQADGHTTCTCGSFNWTCFGLLMFFVAEHILLCVFLCVRCRRTIWRLLRSKDDQGTFTSGMVTSEPSDNQQQDIKKKQRQSFLSASGDNMSDTDDRHRKDPERDPLVTSSPSSTAAREDTDIGTLTMDACGATSRRCDDPHRNDPQKAPPVISCPSSAAPKVDVDINGS